MKSWINKFSYLRLVPLLIIAETVKTNNKNNINKITNNNEIVYKNEKKNKILWINNYKLSCALDSFITIFLFSIYIKLNKEDYKNDSNFNDDFNKYIFILLMDFCDYILRNYLNKNFYFYETYIEYYEKNNLFNFLLLQNAEVNEFIPITTIFRSLYNNKYFIIEYEKTCRCTGNCQYKNQKTFRLYSQPFIDITANNLDNKNNKNFQELFLNEIYENKSKLCDENECINHENILDISYNILNLPKILSISISILSYDELINYKDKVNYYFLEKIQLLNIEYELAGIVFQKRIDHYVCIFNGKDCQSIFKNNYKWFYYDDLSGEIEFLDNFNIALNNYRKSFPISLLIYVKN